MTCSCPINYLLSVELYVYLFSYILDQSSKLLENSIECRWCHFNIALFHLTLTRTRQKCSSMIEKQPHCQHRSRVCNLICLEMVIFDQKPLIRYQNDGDKEQFSWEYGAKVIKSFTYNAKPCNRSYWNL